jgi:hypothetical protein
VTLFGGVPSPPDISTSDSTVQNWYEVVTRAGAQENYRMGYGLKMKFFLVTFKTNYLIRKEITFST